MWPTSANRYFHERQFDRQAGYTLIELLVVLTILGVLIAIVPSVSMNSVRSATLKSVSAQLTADLKDARSNARSENRIVPLTILADGHAYRIDAVRVNRDLGTTITIKYVPLRDLHLSEETALKFYPQGASTGGHLEVSDGQTKRTVAVHWLTGAITNDAL